MSGSTINLLNFQILFSIRNFAICLLTVFPTQRSSTKHGSGTSAPPSGAPLLSLWLPRIPQFSSMVPRTIPAAALRLFSFLPVALDTRPSEARKVFGRLRDAANALFLYGLRTTPFSLGSGIRTALRTPTIRPPRVFMAAMANRDCCRCRSFRPTLNKSSI